MLDAVGSNLAPVIAASEASIPAQAANTTLAHISVLESIQPEPRLQTFGRPMSEVRGEYLSRLVVIFPTVAGMTAGGIGSLLATENLTISGLKLAAFGGSLVGGSLAGALLGNFALYAIRSCRSSLSRTQRSIANTSNQEGTNAGAPNTQVTELVRVIVVQPDSALMLGAHEATTA